MGETTTTSGLSVEEVGDLLADLRSVSGRLARFEHVDQAELDRFEDRKRALLARIDKGSLL